MQHTKIIIQHNIQLSNLQNNDTVKTRGKRR